MCLKLEIHWYIDHTCELSIRLAPCRCEVQKPAQPLFEFHRGTGFSAETHISWTENGGSFLCENEQLQEKMETFCQGNAFIFETRIRFLLLCKSENPRPNREWFYYDHPYKGFPSTKEAKSGLWTSWVKMGSHVDKLQVFDVMSWFLWFTMTEVSSGSLHMQTHCTTLCVVRALQELGEVAWVSCRCVEDIEMKMFISFFSLG